MSFPSCGFSWSAAAIAAQRCCPSLMMNSTFSSSISSMPMSAPGTDSTKLTSERYDAVIEEKMNPSSLSRMYLAMSGTRLLLRMRWARSSGVLCSQSVNLKKRGISESAITVE